VNLPVTHRRALLLVEIQRLRTGEAPTWRELERALALPDGAVSEVLWGLRRNDLVAFTRKPRSLQVTAKGVRAAVNGGRS